MRSVGISMNVVNELRQRLGEDRAVLDRTTLRERVAGIWRPREHLDGVALARPVDTTGVSTVLGFCHEHGLPVVTHGGLTGLVHGADTDPSCVILSLERMNQIEDIDPVQRCARVQAGVPLQTLQQAVEAFGLAFPLDLGARGTATLGGNAATNAGGNRVLRFGMMRDMVLGVEAVLADGTVINSLNSLIKNNAGYDIKQLFLGTEGTLGIITRLSLRLQEAPLSHNMALVACPGFEQVSALLRHVDKGLGGSLSAFECLWRDFYSLVTTPPAKSAPPLAQDFPFYVLLEAQGADQATDDPQFTRVLETALEQGLIEDAAVARSEADCQRLWGIRDDVEQVFNEGHCFLFDISLPLGFMDTYVRDLKATLRETRVQQCWAFGHVGDGNLHLGIQVAHGDAEELRYEVESAVYAPLAAVKGSVSAEHGIGLEKKPWLHISRSQPELALMQQLKVALDSKGILNPGKVISS